MPEQRGEILIWGAGAIGGLIGAYLARAGHQILMVDTVAEHAAACSGPGLAVEGPVETFSQVVPCVTPGNVTGTFGIVILAVKAHATDDALTMLLPHLAADGFVLSAQNGLNELTIAERAGSSRTMGAFVNFGADWIGPGKILFGNRGAVVIGEIDGLTKPRTEDMFQLLRDFEPDAVMTTDIWAYLWGKLAYGAMLFGTALTTDSMSYNFAEPRRRVALAGLAREVMKVARAEGVDPKPFNGFDPAAYWPGAEPSLAEASLDELAAFNSKTAKTHSGIYRDLFVRKRRTEVDQQVGKVVEIAGRHGIEVPLLTRLVQLVHEIEDGKRDLSAETFNALEAIAP
ncbi:2-dehydropantoate 2-reductase [uncultured Roseibium sp.]|uniref:ketopantoate reductase family protein n=1 Tax=uncultured Roseibium sp. TaxID=1936171 RepID=UPI0025932208|nr:2-dehydropantoate 2-reductase [uncultured Roseibium sp.]